MVIDDKTAGEGDPKEKCPCCKIPFLDHTNKQLVKCALAELNGGNG